MSLVSLSTDHASTFRDLSAVSRQMAQAKNIPGVTISTLLRDALTSVKTINAPISVEQFREFNSTLSGVLAEHEIGSEVPGLLKKIGDHIHECMPEKEQIKKTLVLARAMSVEWMERLRKGGASGEERLGRIISTMRCPEERAQVTTRDELSMFDNMDETDLIRAESMRSNPFTPQENCEYPSVWDALLEDYVALLQADRDKALSQWRCMRSLVYSAEDRHEKAKEMLDKEWSKLCEQTGMRVEDRLGGSVRAQDLRHGAFPSPLSDAAIPVPATSLAFGQRLKNFFDEAELLQGQRTIVSKWQSRIDAISNDLTAVSHARTS